MMQRRFVVLLHAGYWTLYLLLAAFLFAMLGTLLRRPVSLTSLLFASPIGYLVTVPNALAFYLSYLILFPRFLARKKLLLLALGILSGAFGSIAVCLPLFTGVFGIPKPAFYSSAEIIGLILSLSSIACLHMIVALVMRGFITWYSDIALTEELKRKTKEVETALIRSKLDPHFLFNTLNNIDVLILRDPEAASHYLNQLSEVLRFILYEAQTERIALQDEFSYVDKYIALQRIRTTNPDYVFWQVVGEAGNLQIAPLILIPFLENAFKHAAGSRSGNVIHISASISGKRLDFECRNRYQTMVPSQERTPGIGNDLIRRRLTLLYGDRYQLTVSDQDNWYIVRLMIELD